MAFLHQDEAFKLQFTKIDQQFVNFKHQFANRWFFREIFVAAASKISRFILSYTFIFNGAVSNVHSDEFDERGNNNRYLRAPGV